VSATVPTGLDLETLEFTLESIDESAERELPDNVVIALDERDEFPEELVRRMCREELGGQLAFVGTEAMRWVAGAGESGGVEQLAARFVLPAIQSAQAGLVAELDTVADAVYDEGAGVFVEVGPKHALQGFASDVLGDDAVLSLATNHHKPGDVASFNGALCGLWAAGLGAGVEPAAAEDVALQPGATAQQTASPRRAAAASPSAAAPAPAKGGRDALADLFPEFLARGRELMGGREGGLAPSAEPVVITGAALGLPGAENLFGKVRVRLGSYRTIELPGRVDADALAPIRAAMGG
jgi:hypothetical protein